MLASEVGSAVLGRERERERERGNEVARGRFQHFTSPR